MRPTEEQLACLRALVRERPFGDPACVAIATVLSHLTALESEVARLRSEVRELRDTCSRALPEVRCLYQQATGERADEAKGSVGQVLAALNAVAAYEQEEDPPAG